MAKFSVDTKLFRELGELLVGRESTALVELVKNAYDADARLVTVLGTDLSKLVDAPTEPDEGSGEKDQDVGGGTIVIADDGIGMTLPIFERGFLTIAGRTKVEGDTRSALFARRFTGEKGVGRLAAHKLAAKLDVISWRWDGSEYVAGQPLKADGGVKGGIDWDLVEDLQTLDDVEGATEALSTSKLTGFGQAGTRLTLTRTRRAWSRADLEDFFNDVATLVPAEALVEPLPKTVVDKPLVFATPFVRDAGANDPGLRIQYAGDFALPAMDVPAAAEAAAWVIEVVCDPSKGQVTIAVEPTKAGRRIPKFRDAEGWSATYEISDTENAVAFSARIFEKENEKWPRAFRGIRVYQEGFRVPPYGDAQDDWLGLDSDYRSRGRGELGRLKRFSQWEVPPGDEGEGLTVKGNEHYFGGVFLTRNGASQLKMLVSREGFLPGPSWSFMQDTLRWAIGIQVRQRRLASHEMVGQQKAESRRRREMHIPVEERGQPASVQSKALHDEAATIVREVKALTSSGDVAAAGVRLDRLQDVVSQAAELSAEGVSEAVMFRILASIGLEQAAFVHEILGLGTTAEAVAAGLERLGSTVPGEQGVRIRALAVEAKELRERLRRNGIYLADMTGVEARKRRSRVNLSQRFDTTADFYRHSADQRSVAIINDLPQKLRSPPVFPAEVSALFSNLLSNAIKFAGTGGKVRASGSDAGDEVVVVIENTGQSVPIDKSESWFEPFRSTTAEVDAVLGQGMGLGLTVSRSLMDEYGGVIRFTTPSDGYATALELRWPKR
ncbi:ATP-binding protein [Brevundimonas sp.]|uniref:sensor histidine kinase n=1 Tax=Brevundimonas sp. TaxID=1871086 RepID=UPI0026368D42|nr:ATP-binding protein [Brevundimonas sp.]